MLFQHSTSLQQAVPHRSTLTRVCDHETIELHCAHITLFLARKQSLDLHMTVESTRSECCACAAQFTAVEVLELPALASLDRPSGGCVVYADRSIAGIFKRSFVQPTVERTTKRLNKSTTEPRARPPAGRRDGRTRRRSLGSHSRPSYVLTDRPLYKPSGRTDHRRFRPSTDPTHRSGIRKSSSVRFRFGPLICWRVRSFHALKTNAIRPSFVPSIRRRRRLPVPSVASFASVFRPYHCSIRS